MFTKFSEITGSAVALHCCKAHEKINRKMGNSTPCKIVTPENIILKLCIRDYVGEMTHHANFGFNRCSGGFPQIGEMLPPCDFFDCPVLTVKPVLIEAGGFYPRFSDSMAAILKIRYDVITPPSIVRLLRNLAGRCKMVCR